MRVARRISTESGITSSGSCMHQAAYRGPHVPAEVLTQFCSRGLLALSTSATPPLFVLGNIFRGAPHLEQCWSGLYFGAHSRYRTPQLIHMAVGIVITHLLPHLKDHRAWNNKGLDGRSNQTMIMGLNNEIRFGILLPLATSRLSDLIIADKD